MLKIMRDQFKHLKIVLWMVIFVFVLLIFVDWGTGRAGRGGGGMDGVAARVGGVTISETAFLKQLRSTEDRYRQMYGQQFEMLRAQMDIGGMTLNEMISQELMIEEAKRLGLRVTDEELLERITSYPAFKGADGQFVGTAMYNRVLRANQMTAEDFESSLRRDMLAEKLQNAVSAGVIVPDEEVEREYRRRNESAGFEVVFVPLETALARAVATEADARAYYDAHQAAFTHPEQRKLRYLLVDDSRLKRAMVVPETQVQEYYSSHQQEFTAGERVRARHILVKPVGQDEGGWKAAEDKIRALQAQIAGGADFVALAREHSEDPGSKDSGGDLGFFERGRMVPEFELAAFGLDPGQVSQPVRTQFGFHLIKLEERAAAAVRPLEEVREQIRMKLAENMADAEGSRRAATLKEKIDAAKMTTEEQWRSLADDAVTSNVTPYFGTGDPIPGLGQDPELLDAIGKADEGTVGGPRRTPRGWIVYRVEDVREKGTTPFEEAKAEATEGAKRAKALELLKAELEGRRALLAGGPLADQAASLGGTAQTVTDHKRGSAIQGVGGSARLEEAVFATAIGALTPAVTVGERGVAIARVTAKQTVDPAQMAKDKDSLRASLVSEETQRLLQALLTERRKESEVVVNPELLERFKPARG